MKRHTKLTAAVLALLALAALFTGLYLSSRPGITTGVKSVVVNVVHKDTSCRSFSFQTDKDYLGDLLMDEGLAAGEQGPYGLYITQVDGEVADYAADKAYWSLLVNGEYALQGADATPMAHGDRFSLVYTIG